MRETLNIKGTFSATAIGKYLLPLIGSISRSKSSGLHIYSVTNPKIKAPNPKQPIINPLTRPFLSGKYSQAHMIGGQ